MNDLPQGWKTSEPTKEQPKIFDSSPKMKNARRGYKRDYPWGKLECGQSFTVPKEDIKLVTLRPMSSNKGREFDPPRQFKVVEHDDCYEVGRIR